jgi:SAM-dependent methyltransferase
MSASLRFANHLPTLHRLLRASYHRWQEARVARVLRQDGATDTSRAERDFEALQARYSQRRPNEYGYSAQQIWLRAADRAMFVVRELAPATEPGAAVLEAGGGDGMLGHLLAGFGHDVTLADMDDWRDQRAKHLPLLVGPLEQGLEVEDEHFDLVVSYNTFEHLDRPDKCLHELVRVTRPGGLIHLDFGPLFAAPFGMHCYRSIPIPYCQFLFSEPFTIERLKELGIYDLGGERETLQPMNRWRLHQFESLWADSGCEIIRYDVVHQHKGLELVHRYPEAFRGRDLVVADLTAAHIHVTLRKPNHRRQAGAV